MDSLSVFTFIWSQVAALQLVKLWNEPGMIYWFTFLSGGVLAGLLTPSKGTVALMAIEGLTLLYTGSQSNHVVLSVFICVAVLTSWNADRTVWSSQCMGSLRLLTGALYLITGIHKLNEGWFDSKYSCAPQMLTGALAVFHFLPHQLVPLALHIIPHCAAGLEILLGFVFFFARNDKARCLAVVSGSMMHLIMGLPYSPMSVYPFSIIMVPLYISLIPTRIEYMADWLMTNRAVVSACAAMVAGIACNLKSILGVEDEMLEYPAYSSWSTGVTWNICMWLSMMSACLVPVRDVGKWGITVQGVVIAMSLFIFGMLPFIGVRTYPAFAMFSNLRTEGDASNHYIFGTGLDVFGYQSDTVEIIDSDIPAVRDMQVDLGLFFDNSTRTLLDKYGLSSEFHIVPPRWNHEKQLPFKRFEVPFIELRRRLSNNKVHGFVAYNRNQVPVMFKSTIGDRDLEQPLNWFEQTFVRFRTFDRNYSPCRH